MNTTVYNLKIRVDTYLYTVNLYVCAHACPLYYISVGTNMFACKLLYAEMDAYLVVLVH